ncbi:hypothetical protein DQ04_02661040 [Trypanosoma grayi]|uniref:hypothetical protein n=1 Tax=Trypanosoma grayi TaxID=71804 RepID=UPI0004F422D4|nr:hypothetical protein DQ04_02661040 [Trypanosoma grayi]KEG11399.1 hypothetical protein DQ04_02661040 [Trypanosoma grayi]
MSLEDRGVVSLWEGEWPWLKWCVTTTRQWVWLLGAVLGNVFDFAGYLATAKMYTAQADRFVMNQTSMASEQLRTRRWILPAAGISATSVFVVVKSAPWGAYRAFRNGAATAALLTCFLFPREIVATTDSMLPFSTAGWRNNGYSGGGGTDAGPSA